MTEIRYIESELDIDPKNLSSFFVGWSKKPSPETLKKVLNRSQYRILALDGERVIGFITAISDGVLSAYIPFLEVLPEYQGKGIGSELMNKMMQKLGNLYMIDLLCDAELQPFYEKLGMNKAVGMAVRNFERQDGE